MTSAQHEALQELTTAVESGDATAVENAMTGVYRAALTPEFVPAFVALLPQRTHQRHEDIVAALQELKDSRAVNALYEAANVEHEYLEYDEFSGLARKCTWALADIGTSEARSRLELLAQHSNPQIAGYATKRLEKWEDERHRKGA